MLEVGGARLARVLILLSRDTPLLASFKWVCATGFSKPEAVVAIALSGIIDALI